MLNRQYLRAVALATFGFIAMLVSSAPAAVIFEEGPNYHVIGYEAGIDQNGDFVAGMVVLRVEYPVIVSGEAKVLTTIEDVILAPGYTYAVKKAGGYDAAVDVDLQGGGCAARFKALYKPGKTVVDGGALICR